MRIKNPPNIIKGIIIGAAIAFAASSDGAKEDTINPSPDATNAIRISVRYRFKNTTPDGNRPIIQYRIPPKIYVTHIRFDQNQVQALNLPNINGKSNITGIPANTVAKYAAPRLYNPE